MFRRILPKVSPRLLVLTAAGALVVAACSDTSVGSGESSDEGRVDSTEDALIVTSGPTTVATPIGLAVRIEEGAGVPIKVRAGQTFYVNQIDMRASLAASVDERVLGLEASGDFATLAWTGVELADESALDAPNADGTFTNRRFFRGAKWMTRDSRFTFTQVDANGAPTDASLVVSAGSDEKSKSSDGFFVRRMRAIQWTFDCVSRTSCAGAQSFQEEALVELRNSMHPEATFAIAPTTTALHVEWSENPGKTYTIPVEQVASPALDYGFTIDLIPITAPGPDGAYAPGSDVTFEVQLRDGAGNLLHAPGVLPSFNSVTFGADTSGIQYYAGFFESFTTYYRRKHMEHQLVSQIVGPAQKVGPIRSVLDIGTALGPDGVVHVADVQKDGFFAQAYELPSFIFLFAGLWDFPVPASFTYHIDADAEAGTYLVTQKGRRVYLGQDIPASKTIEIQVGSAAHTDASLNTGGCVTCHNDNSSLSVVNHGNSNRAACAGCHAPLNFELEGPVYVRTHFIHSRSNRFPGSVKSCDNCHLDLGGIQRTSKSACMSCHTSYPQSHVDQFGPVDNMYVGNADAFQQCTGACHTNHPGSGLN